jgi:hypothetical protein
VLVVGESGQSNDLYDAQAIKVLIEAHRPSWHVQATKKPAILAKGKEKATAKAAGRVAKLYRQASRARPIDCVFNQADTDAVEPSHEQAAKDIEDALASEGCPGHAAVCAWELEAWFFLWPAAIDATRNAWSVPQSLRGRDVGQLTDPKALMREQVLKTGSKPQLAFQEKHAPEVAAQIATRLPERQGKSLSFDRFVERIEACGT